MQFPLALRKHTSELHTGTTTPPSHKCPAGEQTFTTPYSPAAGASPSLSRQNKWTRVSAYAVAFVKEGGRTEKEDISMAIGGSGHSTTIVLCSILLIQKLELTHTSRP